MTPQGDSPRLTLFVAVAENGVIGSNGALPWRLPDDLKRFKALTMGKPCIMGRKTWDSLPKKPLVGRTNIVVTRNAHFSAEGAHSAASFEKALQIAASEDTDEIMVIGGAAIYAAALPTADRILLTEVAAHVEGDASMPPLDKSVWQEISREGPHTHGALNYSYVTLERIR